MNHIDTHLDHHATHVKAGDWLHHGKMVHHKPGFYEGHAAGTFHHVADSPIILPSDTVVTIKLLP